MLGLAAGADHLAIDQRKLLQGAGEDYPEEVRELDGLALVPGMPADLFIKTRERKVYAMFLKPLTGQMQRAFGEE